MNYLFSINLPVVWIIILGVVVLFYLPMLSTLFFVKWKIRKDTEEAGK